MKVLGRWEEARECWGVALQVDPAHQTALGHLGAYHGDSGDVDGCIALFDRILALRPGQILAAQSRLFSINLSPSWSIEDIYREHAAWGKAFSAKVREDAGDAPLPPAANTRDPARRLRIGFLSSDLKTHSVAYYFDAILRHGLPGADLVCFSAHNAPDDMTAAFKGMVGEGGGWREVHGMSAREAATLIRRDGIDILVELNGQSSGNRLDVVALRPAPLQMTYLGYPNTTGLSEVDYRVTDSLADPEDTPQRFTEELLRLPRCFRCVTFGSFNYLGKISADVVKLWSRIMGSVEGSRILLKAKMFSSDEVQRKWRGMFSLHGVAPDRVDLLPHTKGIGGHLDTYARVDIALDPFPYAGTTTTCEALLMGVPVIALKCPAGGPQAHSQNVCATLLSQVSLSEFAAETQDDYASTAASLAQDRSRIAHLRSTLRERLLASPLCDGEDFCQHFGAMCRGAWERWCREGE